MEIVLYLLLVASIVLLVAVLLCLAPLIVGILAVLVPTTTCRVLISKPVTDVLRVLPGTHIEDEALLRHWRQTMPLEIRKDRLCQAVEQAVARGAAEDDPAVMEVRTEITMITEQIRAQRVPGDIPDRTPDNHDPRQRATRKLRRLLRVGRHSTNEAGGR